MVDRIALRNFIVNNFSMDEVKLLCNNLGIDHENLGGDSKQSKVLELVAYCQRHHQSLDLLAQKTMELAQTKLPRG
jgi:hypothetical protein